MVYMYHSFLIHSSADGHLGCFHVLAIINSAAMNTGVHVLLSDLVSSVCMPRSGTAGSYGRSPAQVGYMRQALGAGALGRPRGIGWRGEVGGGIGMGNTCKSMADSCQCTAKPLQYCKVISL